MASRLMKAIGVTVATTAVAMTAVAMAGAAVVDTVRTAPAIEGVQLAQDVPLPTLVQEGGALYARDCAACHGGKGEGGDGPKFVGNTNIASASKIVNQVTSGGQYMPPIGEGYTARQVAAVGSYIRNTWGNSLGALTPAEVTQIRGK